MSARLVLETWDGLPIPQALFPPIRVDAPEEVRRDVYVRNAGDRLAYQVAVELTGDLFVNGEQLHKIGNVQPGDRVIVTITRPPITKRGDQHAGILVRGIEVT